MERTWDGGRAHIGQRSLPLYVIVLFTYCNSISGLTYVVIADLTKKTAGVLVDGTKYPRSWSAIVLLSQIFYVASYAIGLGNVPWQQGELFGLEGRLLLLASCLSFLTSLLILVRGIGTSLATATNWAGNLLIGSTYLSLIDRITPSGAFGFYAGLCLLGWIFVLVCFPETAGLSLEEVRMVFRNGFGIKESGRLRRMKKELRDRERGV